MKQPTIVLVCPACGSSCRTGKETRPEAKMRCPKCEGVFRFFIHGNGAVELRPVEPRPVDNEPAIVSRLPPRSADQDEIKRTRTIFANRRRNRPIGGYMPFEKARSYIGTFAFFAFLGLGAVAGYWYLTQIKIMGNAQGRKGANALNGDIQEKRTAFQKKQEAALKKLAEREKLKNEPTKVQPAEAKAEKGRLPGDRTHD
jgi:hypothetical protein